MSGYSPILELGYDPLTPREKVAVFEPCPGCGADEPRNRCLGCGHDFAPRNRQAIFDGSPVTALASGSGDHAELAEQAGRDIEWSCLTTVRPSVLLDILAENAALRAAGEIIAQKAENAIQQGFSHIDRATEAERKLAEAVGLLRDVVSPGWTREAWSKARSFLSKEAERG